MKKKQNHLAEGIIGVLIFVIVIYVFFYLLPTIGFSFMWIMDRGLELAISIFGDLRR